MKFLVVRFSSIGDIVLTTPVVRALKQQVPNAEVHFITKKNFEIVLKGNPHIDKLYLIEKSVSEVIEDLKNEQYDYVIDLHNNIRTFGLKRKLGRKSFAFPKENINKWLLVNFKKDRMPDLHIVDRYFKAVESLNVKNDHLPCEFYIDAKDEIDVNFHFGLHAGRYVAIAIGAQYATKQIPFEKLIEIIPQIEHPIVLVGGPSDIALSDKLLAHFPDRKLFSTCGKMNLAQSASVVKQSAVLLTNDTGMMHIASCFQLPTISVWGNTVPEFGMYPYFPKNRELFSVHEIKGLYCRPCSKIGYQSCPKKHFRCMLDQKSDEIAADVNRVSLRKKE